MTHANTIHLNVNLSSPGVFNHCDDENDFGIESSRFDSKRRTRERNSARSWKREMRTA